MRSLRDSLIIGLVACLASTTVMANDRHYPGCIADYDGIKCDIICGDPGVVVHTDSDVNSQPACHLKYIAPRKDKTRKGFDDINMLDVIF